MINSKKVYSVELKTEFHRSEVKYDSDNFNIIFWRLRLVLRTIYFEIFREVLEDLRIDISVLCRRLKMLGES